MIRNGLSKALLFGALAFAFAFQCAGATYYVAISGNDSNPGTETQPWRTIQKAANTMVAGDSVLVRPGNYAESIETGAHGTASARIRFRADPPNDPARQAIIRQFRVQHRYNVIEGFNLTGSQDLNNSHIRVEYNPPTDGSHLIVTNNTIRDGVYLMADDLRFNAASNSITTFKDSWLAKGFQPGGYVFLGSNSKDPYVNHDKHWRIKAVTANTIYLTNTARESFLPEPRPAVWGVIYAGNNNDAYQGIEIVPGGGNSAATNCTIVGNTFSNLFGCPIKFRGENHLVENNFVTRIHGYYAIQPHGRNHMIRNNFFKDCTNFIFFTAYEIGNIPHPPGGNFFDYQVAFVSAFVNDSTNVVFERNWLQNIHNQMGLISHAANSYGFTMRSNVFVGVQTHMSGSRSGLKIENNTYYRCSFDESRSQVMGLGGTGGNLQRDLSVQRNVFIDCGSRATIDYEGHYSIVDSTNYVADNNFVCAPETLGYAAKRYFLERNGINGGDPVLANPDNPLGADGVPFTADDGLRSLPNSAFASRPWGALPRLGVNAGTPMAHFRVTSPVGWADPIGTNYFPAWVGMQPYQRGDVMRPWHTPEALGKAPVSVTFSATNSIDGLDAQSTGNAGIVGYRWDFGDGRTVSTSGPTVNNTFTSAGIYTVSLTVTNSLGSTASFQKRYRVRNPSGTRPSAPGNLRVVSTQ